MRYGQRCFELGLRWLRRGLGLPERRGATGGRWRDRHPLRRRSGRELVHQQVGLRAHRLVDTTLLHVFGDADHREPRIYASRAQPLLDRVPPFPSMGPLWREFQRLLLAGKVHHGGHPILRWAIHHLELAADAAGNHKPTRQNESAKIDAAVALLMAIDRHARRVAEPPTDSVYDTRGVLIFD